ncbi:Cytochrome c biogenesis protein CcdA [Seinonella peptonophila]|uniref:Cytochrome c biogenesis protein CcdA n=1 Tax=Seinonella peptonophila TaxID=112248 RepID=A0A1M4SXV0_9BACL|nr:sulfite exporter TauE/SafE family protein [Seinonella peptonophila]SHE37046.1 Cytochrome c biogenesis protein CcdA [Seinonella peptonophila]
MYHWLTELSQWMSYPFEKVVFTTQISIFIVFFLGITGALSPCQLTSNMGAIAFFSAQRVQSRKIWLEMSAYVIGKVLVYATLGYLTLYLGKSLAQEAIPIFSIMRKWMGPLFILMGLFLIGWLSWPMSLRKVTNHLSIIKKRSGGVLGAFLMGVTFSLAFCPTMVVIFFGGFVPLLLSEGKSIIFPLLFGIGTALPLLLIMAIITISGVENRWKNQLNQWSKVIRRMVGCFLLILGLFEIFIYWATI